MVALCLTSKCRDCVVFERGVVYSQLLYCPKSSVEVPCVGSPMWTRLVEILLCEGGDVELFARTSKHIRVFAIDPLSLTLSFVFCIASYCSYLIRLILFVCHTCVEPREL